MRYDTWLEQPYDARAALDAAFEQFCEAHGYDIDDPDALAEWEAWSGEVYEPPEREKDGLW